MSVHRMPAANEQLDQIARTRPRTTAAISELGDIARQLLDQQKEAQPASRDGSLDPAVVSLWQETAKQRDALAEKVAALGNGNSTADPLSLLDKVLSIFEKINRQQAAAPQRGAVEQLQEMVTLIGSLRDTFSPAENTAPAVSEDGSILRAILNAVSPVLSQLAARLDKLWR